MLKQTIIWTALPHGSEGVLKTGTKLHLSAFVSPRLWNDDASVKKMKLNSFPDFLDWPAVIDQATFQVEFEGGPTLSAAVDKAPLRSDLWKALFKLETDVIPYTFEDLSGAEIMSWSSATIHDTLKRMYQRAAIDPKYGAGSDMPSNDTLANDPDLGDIARPVRPEPPFEPTNPDRGPVVLDEPEEPKPPPGKGCLSGCLAYLLTGFSLIRTIVRWLLKALGLLISGLLFSTHVPGSRLYLSPNGDGGGVSLVANKPFDQLSQYLAPTSTTSTPLPTQTEVQDTFDFHKMIAALGDYPSLLHNMGLVVDLTVTLSSNLPLNTSTVRLIVNLPLQLTTTNHTPRTHYELGDERFVTRPRPTSSEIKDGLLRLNDGTLFKIQQVDVAGGGIKLQNTATNIVGIAALNEQPANAPDDGGLSALQTAGISIVRPDKVNLLRQVFLHSYALNAKLAAIDASPLPPPAGAQPAPPATDEIFAEDVVRGYRLDVWDDQSNQWHSLCQRLGTYKFQDALPNPITLDNISDEGFVQMGTTESLVPSATRVLRVHESLFTWDGWSLSAPRPSQAILPDQTTGDVDNPAVTNFKLETAFHAKLGTLPRLRFGYSYRLRARVVDLAGNSVFNPDDAAFSTSQPEITPLFKFTRFEPVSSPPVVLREVPKEGESLERLTVRSTVEDAPGMITSQTTERHIVPPKTAQLMIERHRLFDNTPGMDKSTAGYNLASREAGSITHRLNTTTGDLDLIDGISEVTDTTQKRTYWLQTKAQFEVAYLPDPYARGVLLLGLPGMAAFDEIVEPEVGIVNKIPFDGTWPDMQAFRLRVQGVPDGGTPAQPKWNPTDRTLTVQLPQGVTADVRIASYFHADDLENMGVWTWTVEATPPDLATLRQQAIAGRNWLHLPYRELVLVHAVQQPLKIPVITSSSVAKLLGETSATLNGQITVDGKSTGKIDLWSAWTDPFDDVSKPTYDSITDVVSQRMHVGEIIANDPASDQVVLNNLLHRIGDTKYHKITYTPIATTRFREYFPAAIISDPQNLVRPLSSEAPIETPLDIPNSARPDAVKPLYILPTFQWSETVAGNLTTHVRRGGGLRIYMERPWFSSGAGELLGILLRPDAIDPLTEEGETIRKYTSEWGMDPIWNATQVSSLRSSDFDNAVTHSGLSLAELPVDVDVVAYQPEYDTGRNLWYANVELLSDRKYFPFVRLALARYQPISVSDAHLSRVALSDFVQVVPHRTVEYDLTNLNVDSTIRIKVSGPSYLFRQMELLGSSLMVVGIEKRQFADATDELGWEPVATTQLPPVQQLVEETIWEGKVSIPNPALHPLRVVVMEAELFRTDGSTQEDIPRLLQQELFSRNVDHGLSEVGDVAHGYRVVFADELIIA